MNISRSGLLLLTLVTATFTGKAQEAKAYRDLVDHYCVGCHNERAKVAGLALDKANLERVSESAEVWEKVIRKLRASAMPPPAMPQPRRADREAFVGWLENRSTGPPLSIPIQGGHLFIA